MAFADKAPTINLYSVLRYLSPQLSHAQKTTGRLLLNMAAAGRVRLNATKYTLQLANLPADLAARRHKSGNYRYADEVLSIKMNYSFAQCQRCPQLGYFREDQLVRETRPDQRWLKASTEPEILPL